MRKRLKPIFDRIAKPLAKLYFSKPRNYSYKNIKGKVLPDVFHPQLTISTRLFMEFLEDKNLKGKTFLELGCGTGFISVFAAKKGANVLATDNNPKALENAHLNASMNEVEIQIMESDLFQNIRKQQFDFVIINPPYYPKKPANIAEQAWFCGENFEYFENLFSQLGDFVSKESKVFMILSEDCELETIQTMAKKDNLVFETIHQTKRQGEENYIFSITKKAS